MPDKRVSALTEVTAVADNDLLYVVDVSDTADSSAGSSRYAQAKNVRGWPQTSAESAAGVTPTNYQYEPGNVLRYGTNTAPGTTNMTTAIQNAVDAMKGGGGRVYLPSGTYLTSSEILIDDGVTFYGDGSDSIIQPNAETFSAIRLESASDFLLNKFALRDFAIVWGSVASTATAIGIQLDDSGGANRYPYGGKISNVVITNAHTGIKDDTSAFDIIYEGIRVRPGVRGFWMDKIAGPMYALKNCYADMRNSTTGRAFDIQNCRFLYMSGCAVDQYDGTTECVFIETCSGVVETFDCEANTTTNAGMFKLSDCELTVIGCKFSQNTVSAAAAGIMQTTTNSNITFIGNTVSANTATGSNNTAALTIAASTTSAHLIGNLLEAPTGGTGSHKEIIDAGGIIRFRLDDSGIYGPTAGNLPISTVQGISQTTTAATNLRGSVTFATAGTAAVTFGTAEPDASYYIAISGDTGETFHITSKATTGFTVNSSNASSTATVDWVLIR